MYNLQGHPVYSLKEVVEIFIAYQDRLSKQLQEAANEALRQQDYASFGAFDTAARRVLCTPLTSPDDE